MNTNKSNTLLRTIAIFVGILVFLVGGAGVTKVAADAAIPGDALYPVKTAFDQARLSLAQDAGERAQMKLSFADKHLKEIEALVAEGRYREIRQTVVEFETDINSALLELETVSKTDPTRATALAAEVASALTRYATILSELSVSVPEQVRGEVTRALDTTNIAGGLNQANSNDNANSNANANANGNDNANSNDNVNTNDDDANSNDDDANSNGDDSNSNDDDSNANGNSNDDDANSNDDDSNSNDDDSNANGNSNDDDANSNDDDDAGSNSNDDDSNANSNDDSGSDDSGSDDSGGDNSGSGSDDSGSDDRGGDDSGKDDKSDD